MARANINDKSCYRDDNLDSNITITHEIIYIQNKFTATITLLPVVFDTLFTYF